jgi:hypothetical protein
VSSYNESLAVGPRFSVHLADSAKTSSSVHSLLTITPDHESEFAESFCPISGWLTKKSSGTADFSQCFAMSPQSAVLA